MARICIVTPGQLGSNPRVVKEASALSDAGHDVHVIATKVAAFVEPRDQAVLAMANFKVTRVSFDVPAHWRTARLRQAIARRAWTVVPSRFLAATAHSAMSRGLAAAARSIPADLYIAHYVAALPAAAKAAQVHGGVYAFDAEDFHLGDLPDLPEHELDKKLIFAIEGRYLKGAAFTTAAAPGIAEAYAAKYGIARPIVVLNTFPKAQAPNGPSLRGSIEPGPSVYWFSQTIGPNRGLECAIAAISLARSAPHLHLRGTLAPDYEVKLRGLASVLGAADRLHIHAPGPPDAMVRLAAEHDVGLVSETAETRSRRIALTNKQFTYLLAGVPAVMSDIEAHVAFAANADGAVLLHRVEDAQSLAAAFDDLLSDPGRLAQARTQAFALGQQRFNWEAEAPILLDSVSRALDTARTQAA
jgi:glycosyltransferase involved in cell wall biosynthesis